MLDRACGARKVSLMSAIAGPIAATGAQRKPSPSGWDQLKTLFPYVARYKLLTALGLVTLALMGLIGSLPQLLIGAITDCLKGSPQPLSTLSGTSRAVLHPLFSFYAPLDRHALGLYCLILVAVMLVKGFLSFWTRWILIGISREIEYDLRNDLLASLVKLEPEFYVRNRTGDLMSRATNDLNAVRMVLGPGIMYTATTIATMVLAIFFMVKLSPVLTLWVLIPVPIVALAVRYFGQIIHRLSEQIQAALGVLSTRAQENLTGIRVIRAYVQEQPEIEAFDTANREYVNRNIKLIGTWSLFFPALSALIGLTVVILLEIGGIQVIDQHVSLGTFSAFYAFLVQLVWPMIALGWVTNIFQRGAASMGRLNYILTAEPHITDSAAAPARPSHAVEKSETRFPIRGEIEFRHLAFAYPGVGNGTGSTAVPVLHDINLHVPAGSTLAIVGPTGSGKSTLAQLVARLWEAPPGSLLIDGRPIQEYPLEQFARFDRLRSSGYVPYLARRFAKISPLASRMSSRNASLKPPKSPVYRVKSKASPSASTRWSAKGALRFPADKNSGPLSRARFLDSPESSSSMTRYRSSTPVPNNASCAACAT